MLAGHVRFLAQKSSSDACKIKNDLMDVIRSLHQMPKRSQFMEDKFISPTKYHKMFVEKWYLILFRVKDQTVYVDYYLYDFIRLYFDIII